MPAHLIAETEPHRGLVFNLQEGEEWLIGRDPDEVAFVLEDDTVSRRHVRLVRAPEGIYLENLSDVNPVLVNDEQHDGPILLQEGDRVQIGSITFLFSEEDVPKIGQLAREKKRGGYDEIFGSLEETSEELPIHDSEEFREDTDFSSKSNPYDTIFEDSGEEPQLPFSLLSETPFLLKVIAGPNAGAEIGIEKGKTYTIGKDHASCDIVFQDLSVSRHHARLHVTSDGIVEIEDLGSKNGTIVNGSPIKEKVAVVSQDLISMGTTVFFIIDREAPQETIYTPSLAVSEEPKEEIPKVEEILPPEEVLVEEKKDWKKEPIPFKYLMLAGAFAAVALIAFLSFFSLFKAQEIEVVRNEPVDQIKKAIAKFSNVQFSFNPASGKLFLVGHVLTAVDAQEMRFRIGEIDFVLSIEDNVVIDEFVSKMINDVLASNPNFRAVSIHALEAGKFVAAGYVDTVAMATQLSESLVSNFPYLDRLDNQVVIGDTLNAQLQSLLQSKGLGMIAFQYVNGAVVLSGNYSDRMQAQFQDVLAQMKTLRGVHAIQNLAVPSDPNLAAIDLSQQVALSGIAQYDGQGYGAVLNGKIYLLGDTIDGMKITQIDAMMILLEKDGIKYKINYTR